MKVVALDRLVPERGAAVLVDGQQIALFRVVEAGPDGPVETVHAISHHDPFSGANVMARGILGSAGKQITVASPLYKQVFDLTTGVCLADPAVRLAVWRTRIEEGYVHVDPEPVLDGPQDATAPVAAVHR